MIRDVLGPFRLTRELGSGGMRKVYAATRERLPVDARDVLANEFPLNRDILAAWESDRPDEPETVAGA